MKENEMKQETNLSYFLYIFNIYLTFTPQQTDTYVLTTLLIGYYR